MALVKRNACWEMNLQLSHADLSSRRLEKELLIAQSFSVYRTDSQKFWAIEQ